MAWNAHTQKLMSAKFQNHASIDVDLIYVSARATLNDEFVKVRVSNCSKGEFLSESRIAGI